MRLNEGLGSQETWNEAAIQRRAKGLAEKAVQVWVLPHLSKEAGEALNVKADQPPVYTLDHHTQLLPGSLVRPLFDRLSQEVMALDPCVTEEVRKLYVAFKAETNFVDVVPQKSRLRLSLNMRFHELHDPKEIARDVTNIGRWGNGDVEVGLDALEDLPYVMGLIRQSFEKQIGNGATEA